MYSTARTGRQAWGLSGFRFLNLVNGVGGKSFGYDARVSRETTRLGWIKAGQSIIVPTARTTAGSATDLRREASVIIDLVAGEQIVAEWRELADRYGARFTLVEYVCSDRDMHRKRVEDRNPRHSWLV